MLVLERFGKSSWSHTSYFDINSPKMIGTELMSLDDRKLSSEDLFDMTYISRIKCVPLLARLSLELYNSQLCGFTIFFLFFISFTFLVDVAVSIMCYVTKAFFCLPPCVISTEPPTTMKYFYCFRETAVNIANNEVVFHKHGKSR